jgi:hypothetical protein
MAVSLTILRMFPARCGLRSACAPAENTETLSLGSTVPGDVLESISPKSWTFPELPISRTDDSRAPVKQTTPGETCSAGGCK